MPVLAAGDIVIDGGNSHYADDIRREQELKPRGVHYVDVGTSGGLLGLERGYCLMIGGDDEAVQQLDPILAALAQPSGDGQRHREHRDPRLSALSAPAAPATSSRWSTTASNTA